MNKSLNNAYVIGAGITGLSTAYFLAKSGQYRVTVFEKEDMVGGMAKTIRRDKMYLDLGPHKFFSNLKKQEKEVKDIIGKKNSLNIFKSSQIRLFDNFLDFPVGPLDVFKINPFLGLKMAISFGIALIKGKISKKKEISYEDYLKSRFGPVTYNLTLAPYANKIWANPKTLDKELASTRVAAPSLFEMVKQMVFKVKSEKLISVKNFFYPIMGSGVLADKLVSEIRKYGGKVEVGKSLEDIKMRNNTVSEIIVKSKILKIEPQDVIISTIPLEELSEKSFILKKNIGKQAKSLKYKNLVLVYVVLKQSRVSKQNWYFFPEGKYVFNRVFEQKSFSSFMVPPNKTVLCAEVTCDAKDKTWKEASDININRKVVSQLCECGLIRKERVINTFTKRMEHAYPIYEIDFRKRLDKIFETLDDIKNFYSVGRQGGFNYVGMIDCFDIGEKTSSYILNKSGFSTRGLLRNSFYNYVVID